jgi:hypothetical protein
MMAQRYEWQALLGPVTVELDDEGIRYRSHLASGRRRWDGLTGGAISRPAQARETAPTMELFGDLNRLFSVTPKAPSMSDAEAATWRLLVLSSRRFFGALVQLPWRAGDPQAEALIAEVAARMGDRWHGEVKPAQLRKVLGVRSLW